IKLGRYLDELPEVMVEQADRLAFPLILLPNDVGFDDILNQVLTDILNRQAAMLARTEEAHRALVQIVLAGGGLREVTAEVAGLLQVAVAAVDRSGRILATAGDPAQVARLREIHAAAADVTATSITPVFEADHHYTAVPVVAGGHHYGRIAAYSPHEPLGAGEIQILERAATVAALVITKQEAITAVESKYRAVFLRDVLAGRGGARVTDRARAFGWDLERPMCVLVAEIDPDAVERPIQDRMVSAWQAAVRKHDPCGAVAGFSHEVVAVVGSSVDPVRLARDARSAVPDGTFSTGISRVAQDAGALPGAYGQALKAARVGRQLHGAGAIAHFDELGVYRLL